MPELIHNLQGRDLGHLRIIADLWGIEFDAPDAHVGLQRLLPLMLAADRLDEVLSSLPEDAMGALDELLRNNARLPWALFTRRFGELREMGPSKRDRERPYLAGNATASEALWYRGLVGRSFFDGANGPEEFAYIPEDLLPFMPLVERSSLPSLGRPATNQEKARCFPANDSILDDACTLLAGLRLGLSLLEIESVMQCGRRTPYPLTAAALLDLLKTADLVDARNLPKPGPVRQFLEAEPGQALASLFEAWLRSVDFNELHLAPGLITEGQWKNDPQRTRQMVIDFISTIPGASTADANEDKRPFWSLGAFISAIYQNHPDFQRPAGDYNSWYIRDIANGKFLRGFEHWDEVDGALLRFMLGGVLHWVGLLDLATPETDEVVSAFRFSKWAANLLNFQPAAGLKKDDEPVTVRADGRLRLLPHTGRAGRYQLARFCEWQGFADGFYRYRLTPTSLERARKQGLRIDHLLALLTRYSQASPPTLIAALKRWDSQGSLATIEGLVVLRVKHPDMLQALRDSSASRFLGEILGPTAIVVKPGGWQKVSMVLAEMGYLTETLLEEKESS